MSYVIRLPKAIPNGQCWYDFSDGDPGRTGQIMKAAEFMSMAVAEKKLAELRKKYPDREFVIDPAPEGMKGTVIGDNYWIV